MKIQNRTQEELVMKTKVNNDKEVIMTTPNKTQNELEMKTKVNNDKEVIMTTQNRTQKELVMEKPKPTIKPKTLTIIFLNIK